VIDMSVKTHAPLTERYVAAVLANVQGDRRTAVEDQLRASIAEAFDAKVALGESPGDAERAVLTEFGNPMRLSADLSGRPLHLIGPAYYLDYVRLLKLLLSIVVPTVGVVVGAASAIAGAGLGDVIVTGIGAAFTAFLQVAFWVTVVFALLERRGMRPPTGTKTWDVSRLPDLPERRIGLGGTIGSITGLAVLVWFLLWQPGYQESFDPGGPSIPILDPALNSVWIPLLVCVLLASIGLEIVKYLKGRWTLTMAVVNTVLSLAFTLPAIWLLTTDRLLNPTFLASMTVDRATMATDAVLTLIVWGIAVVSAITITEGWWKALRSP
jgi:hypothetical protein